MNYFKFVVFFISQFFCCYSDISVSNRQWQRRPSCGMRSLGNTGNSFPFFNRNGRYGSDADMVVAMVGGHVTSALNVPWQVTIRYHGYHACGGSIVSSRYILTAAHCFSSLSTSPYDWTVYVSKNERDLGENGEIGPIYVQSINIHQNYRRGSFNHDIALMRLRTSLTYSPTIQPICLPKAGSNLMAGTKCYASGYGETQGTGGEGKLKEGKVPVYLPTTCYRMYGMRLTNSMLCAGYPEGGIDSCQGDSGGPLFCEIMPGTNQFVLQGIVSYGMGCAKRNRPGVYTRTANYGQWIRWVVVNRY